MSLDDLLQRRALRLKDALVEGDRPKPSLFSVIYPATDYGKNSPPVTKTASSIPNSNNKEAMEKDEPPKPPKKEVDEPGPSKTTSASLPAALGQSAMVPLAHKQTMLGTGGIGEDRAAQFIDRCVSLITGVKKLEQADAEQGDDDEQEEPAPAPAPVNKAPAHSRLSLIAAKLNGKDKASDNYG